MSIGPETFVNYVQLQIVLKKSTRGLYKCWRNLVLNETFISHALARKFNFRNNY